MGKRKDKPRWSKDNPANYRVAEFYCNGCFKPLLKEWVTVKHARCPWCGGETATKFEKPVIIKVK